MVGDDLEAEIVAEERRLDDDHADRDQAAEHVERHSGRNRPSAGRPGCR